MALAQNCWSKAISNINKQLRFFDNFQAIKRAVKQQPSLPVNKVEIEIEVDILRMNKAQVRKRKQSLLTPKQC
jgi:hypothetical protein